MKLSVLNQLLQELNNIKKPMAPKHATGMSFVDMEQRNKDYEAALEAYRKRKDELENLELDDL